MKRSFKITLLKKITIKTAEEISAIMKQHAPNLKKLSPQYLKNMIKNPAVKIFTAVNRQGQIVGIVTMITYYKTNGLCKAYIEDLVVNQANRRQGIGRALMETVIATAKKTGADMIHLTSHPSRLAANRLYQQLGFTIYNTNYFKYKSI